MYTNTRRKTVAIIIITYSYIKERDDDDDDDVKDSQGANLNLIAHILFGIFFLFCLYFPLSYVSHLDTTVFFSSLFMCFVLRTKGKEHPQTIFINVYGTGRTHFNIFIISKAPRERKRHKAQRQ